jgi:DNA polymerase-3 subunit delta'
VHLDFKVVSPADGKDIGIDAMREVIETAGISPTTAPLRLFVIDGADRMTSAAANALLKTLEEPPETSRFFLLAEQMQRVIPTIRSRCGKVPFSRLPESVVVAELSKFERDNTKALVYARMADGSLGRATRYWGAGRLRTRDQAWTLLEQGFSGDLSSLFSAVDAVTQDIPLVLRFLELILHDFLMIHHEPGRIVNVDLADKINALASEGVLVKALPRLLTGTRVIRDRMRASKINAAFHMKTLFVEAFSGN